MGKFFRGIILPGVFLFLINGFLGCSGSGVKLIISNIEGPESVQGRIGVDYSVMVSGDTGITYHWTCVPALAGEFDSPTLAKSKFTPLDFPIDTEIEISLIVNSDNRGPVIRTKDVTITPIDGLWVGEIEGPDSIEEETSAFFSIDAAGDGEMNILWTVDLPEAVNIEAKHAYKSRITPIAVKDDSSIEVIVSVALDEGNPIERRKTVSVKDISRPGWAKTWGAYPGWGNTIAFDDNGDFYVTGDFVDTVDFDPGPLVEERGGEDDSFLSKFDATGDFLWVRTWGVEVYDFVNYVRNCGLTVDSLGNIYVVGFFSGTADFDPGPGTDWHTSLMRETGDPAANISLSKFDSDGNFEWTRTWGGDWDPGYSLMGWVIDATTDTWSNVYITGHFYGTGDFDPGPETAIFSSHEMTGGTPMADAFTTKFNSLGEYQWAKTWGGPAYEYSPVVFGTAGCAIDMDSSGLIYVVGDFEGTVDFDPGPGVDEHSVSPTGVRSAFLTIFDNDGEYQWSGDWGGATYGEVYAHDLVIDYSGNIYITGCSRGAVDFDPGPDVNMYGPPEGFHAYLSKFGPMGNHLWVRNWGHNVGGFLFWTSGFGVDVCNTNEIYVTGIFPATVDFDPGPDVDEHIANDKWENGDVFLSRFNSEGDFVWARTWGGLWRDVGYSVACDPASHIYVVGEYIREADFDPGPGIDMHKTEFQNWGIFLSKFPPDGDW